MCSLLYLINLIAHGSSLPVTHLHTIAGPQSECRSRMLHERTGSHACAIYTASGNLTVSTRAIRTLPVRLCLLSAPSVGCLLCGHLLNELAHSGDVLHEPVPRRVLSQLSPAEAVRAYRPRPLMNTLQIKRNKSSINCANRCTFSDQSAYAHFRFSFRCIWRGVCFLCVQHACVRNNIEVAGARNTTEWAGLLRLLSAPPHTHTHTHTHIS
jgi:hypothetical protein